MIEDASTATISENILLVGYVLDEALLRRIDELIRTSLRSDAADGIDVESSYFVSTQGSRALSFESIEALIAHFSTARDSITEVRLDYRASDRRRIRIVFDRYGMVALRAYGRTPDIHFVAESLTREIRTADPGYNWIIRHLAFSRLPRFFLSAAAVLLSICLTFQLLLYFYAQETGVNVDPALLYEGNTYAHEVERAIKSESVEDKLDTLLKGELKGFSNVSDILQSLRASLTFFVMALLFVVVGILALRSFRRAFPRAFFALGRATEQLARLQRTREIWVVGVIIAFVVNLVTGVIVAIAFS